MKWEYMLLSEATFRSTADEVNQLNSLGAQGWELVTVLQMAVERHIYLKRKLSG